MTTIFFDLINFIKTLSLQLWFSISSVKFYEEALKKSEDYGVRYILNLSFISSLICTMIFLNNIDNLQSYLKNESTNAKTEDIDFILRQIPPIEYDGQKISIGNGEPLLIKNRHNIHIIAIDPNNQIKPSDRDKLPMILSRDKIIIKLIDSDGEVISTFPVKLDQIFGNDARVLTNDEIKASFIYIFDKAPRLLIYVIFPLLGLLILFNTFLDKSFFIIMIFFIAKLSNLKISMKACLRLTMYASGFYALLQFIFVLAASKYLTIVWVVQSWANILMILGILKANGKNYFFKQK
jgi:hypothetical protein